MSRKLTAVALAVAAVCPAAANAFDLNPEVFSFSGFGTIGAVHSSEDQADYTAGAFQPNGAGYSHEWSYDVDTLLGLQMTARLSSKLQAVVQVVGQQRYDNSYTPEFEWANLKYSFTPDFSVRAGRIAMPTYLASDTRNVHYAMPVVRPAPEVYRLLPITNSDGVDVSYRFNVGGVSNTVQAIYGTNTTAINDDFSVRAEGVWAVVNNTEWNDLLVHLAYQGQQMNYETLLFSLPNRSFKIKEIGVSYDPGKWFVSAEGARTQIWSGSQEAFAINGGARISSVTGYIGYAQMEYVTPSLFGPAAEQKTATVGARWDFMSNFAFKAQYDHVDIAEGSTGTLTNIQPGFQPGGSTNVISFAVDFVF
jgi:hypothetical protein